MLLKPELDEAVYKQGSYTQWKLLIGLEFENQNFMPWKSVKSTSGRKKTWNLLLDCLTKKDKKNTGGKLA